VNLGNLPSTITGFLLLILREIYREQARSGKSVEELLDSAIKQTGINESRIQEMLDQIEQDMR
jgi:urease gamma subunit